MPRISASLGCARGSDAAGEVFQCPDPLLGGQAGRADVGDTVLPAVRGDLADPPGDLPFLETGLYRQVAVGALDDAGGGLGAQQEEPVWRF
jgi:hypothetical protein